MSSTEAFIKALGSLKNGDLGLLRTHAGQGLDESVDGFDVCRRWWPLRQKNQWYKTRNSMAYHETLCILSGGAFTRTDICTVS